MANERTGKWASDFARNLIQTCNTRTAEEAVVQLVEEKLAIYKSLNHHHLKHPINLEWFASTCNIRMPLEYVKMKQDARLVQRDGGYYIQINASHKAKNHRGRRRFSIAHEIGHKILAVGNNPNTLGCVDIGLAADPSDEEKLCDYAAKHILLLSPPFITPILQKHGISVWAIQQIKVDFDVSFEAATRALVDHAPGKAAVFYFASPSNRFSQHAELKFTRCYKSPDLTLEPLQGGGMSDPSCIFEAFVKGRPVEARERVQFNNGNVFEVNVYAIPRHIYVKRAAKRGVIALLSDFVKC